MIDANDREGEETESGCVHALYWLATRSPGDYGGVFHFDSLELS